MNCQICTAPLSEAELSLNLTWHQECEQCFFCHSTLPSFDQITKCLAQGRPVSHEICFKNALSADFRDKKFPLYQAHIDALNEEILSTYPPVDPTSLDFEVLNKLYHRLKEATANVGLAMDATREKLKIQTNNKWREEQTAKARERRTEQAIDKVKKVESTERQIMLKAEREDPALKMRRKALEQLMTIGLSREAAEAMLNKQTGKIQ